MQYTFESYEYFNNMFKLAKYISNNPQPSGYYLIKDLHNHIGIDALFIGEFLDKNGFGSRDHIKIQINDYGIEALRAISKRRKWPVFFFTWGAAVSWVLSVFAIIISIIAICLKS